MKKLFTLVTLLLVAAMLVVPVSAAQSATMTVTVSGSTVAPGETVTVTVSTTAVENCFSGGFMFSFDKDVFEYVSGSALVKGYAISGISTVNDIISGYFMNTDKGSAVEGGIFEIILKVKDTAAEGSYTITGTPSLTVLNGTAKETITCSATGATVTVSTKTEPDPEPAVKLGDANGDGKVNLKDAILTLQAANNKPVTIDRNAADVTGDAKVNIKDAILVLKRANGNKDPFPAEK